MKRKENGVTTLQARNGQNVVAFDAIAKLSGVSGGGVVKVLAAMRAIADYEGDQSLAGGLGAFENVPTGLADEYRARATAAYAHDLAEALEGHELAPILRLDRLV